MPVAENSPRQLVLKSGSTTLTLDKDAGKATLQRKLLIWRLKPIEAPLSDVSDVTVDTAVDRASGVEVCHTMLVRRAPAKPGPCRPRTKKTPRSMRLQSATFWRARPSAPIRWNSCRLRQRNESLRSSTYRSDWQAAWYGQCDTQGRAGC
jgi:hypothetical protein